MAELAAANFLGIVQFRIEEIHPWGQSQRQGYRRLYLYGSCSSFSIWEGTARYYYIRCTIERARKSDLLKYLLVAIVRDFDVVPDDPDPVDLAVALLPPSLDIFLGMYYPPDWPANDASATGRKIHDVNMTSKHIDPS